MLDKASLKLGLDRAVLQSMSGNKDNSVNGVRMKEICVLYCCIRGWFAQKTKSFFKTYVWVSYCF